MSVTKDASFMVFTTKLANTCNLERRRNSRSMEEVWVSQPRRKAAVELMIY
jgi:hypothetical protein